MKTPYQQGQKTADDELSQSAPSEPRAQSGSRTFLTFLKGPAGTVAIFVILFYLITFAVYYLYSLGPEERRQAEDAMQNRGLTEITQQGN